MHFVHIRCLPAYLARWLFLILINSEPELGGLNHFEIRSNESEECDICEHFYLSDLILNKALELV